MIAPHVNNTFEISHKEAGALWSESQPLPIPDKNNRSERLRRSACGQWVVRQFNMFERLDMAAEDLVETVSREYDRLKTCGIDVLSHAITPSVTHTRVFTVTPWLPNVRLCDTATFDAVVAPKLETYMEAPPSTGYLNDVECEEQFALTPDRPAQPFLLDLDPYIGKPF